MTAHTAKKKPSRKSRTKMPLPAEAGRAIIGGKEFILFPSEDFEDWYVDQVLTAVAVDRLKNERHLAVPMEDVFARQDAKRKGK